MKTSRILIISILCAGSFHSCNPSSITEDSDAVEFYATGDKGDATGKAEDGDND